MLSPKIVMFLGFCLIMMSLVCAFLEGGNVIEQTDVDMVNEWTGYNVIQDGNVNLIVLAGGFFIHGLPKMILWEYSFFNGGLVIIRIILILVFSGGVLWGVYSSIVSRV